MNDLKLIKKHYGEKMMHLCRELFPSLLEKEGLLFSLLESNFAYSKFLYDDIVNRKVKFKDYIYSLVDVEKKEIEVLKTPKELLDEAGYILYECKTEEDIQNFKKYYAKNEELCTFNGGRLNNCHVFFAVKKNVDDVKRENFKIPNRQDEYGTSVISIQFSRGKTNTLSIKNRYNHTVNNPDATFSNNLENIIEGLTSSFEKEYKLNISQNSHNNFELDGYVKANDGKFYKYNYEIANIYYCPDNIIIDNFEVKHYEKEKYLIIDYFILDLVNKKIIPYDNYILTDPFCGYFEEIKINTIEIVNNKDQNQKKITIIPEYDKKIFIVIDKYNRMISYKNENLTSIDEGFLWNNIFLRKIDLPNASTISDEFLYNNTEISEINIPNAIKIGKLFLKENDKLREINLPKVIEVDNHFLRTNYNLQKIDLPSVQYIGNDFLLLNKELKKLNLPNVKVIGDNFLYFNEQINKVNLQNVEQIGINFLFSNISLQEISFPKVKTIGINHLFNNTKTKKIWFNLVCNYNKKIKSKILSLK